ncbi:MAG: hypothetical protein ACM3VS_17705 [Candidatus Dadabacteria bacterium]
MKKVLLLLAGIITLVSCNKSKGPKEASEEFVSTVYVLDFNNAANLSSSDTKQVIDKNEVVPMDPSPEKRKVATIKKDFLLDSFKVEVNGNNAVVQNEILTLPLKKEQGGWKVVASKELLDEIINRQQKLQILEEKWNAVQKAYDDRNQIAKQYITYAENRGALSEAVKALKEAVNGVTLEQYFTKEQLFNYVRKQDVIAILVDKAIVPSQSANTDLTATFIIQLHQQQSVIDNALKEYNAETKLIKSPVYVAIPGKG